MTRNIVDPIESCWHNPGLHRRSIPCLWSALIWTYLSTSPTIVLARVDRVHEGTVSSDHYHDDPAQSADNAFDFSIYTQWRANSLPATIEYTFNNERNEWINAYAIWNGISYRIRSNVL